MSKYDLLWEYVQKKGVSSLILTFEEIQEIAGIPMDHSFLKYKKILPCIFLLSYFRGNPSILTKENTSCILINLLVR